MSEPPSTAPQPSPPPLLPPPLPPPPQPSLGHHPILVKPEQYSKGNWTIQETLTLIKAKKLDDERRRQRPSALISPSSSGGGESRWKWIENYCWAHGCHRSQNQCNDKWDNLLREYKKVREYQSRVSSSSSSSSFSSSPSPSPSPLNAAASSSAVEAEKTSALPSYWTMERDQRKLHGLPSNLSFEVFEALNEVVQKKHQRKLTTTTTTTTTTSPTFATTTTTIKLQETEGPEPEELQQQQHFISPVSFLPAPAEPVVEVPATSERPDSSRTESSDKLETDTAKRRKVHDNNIGSSITDGASILAKTIRDCENRKEKRHREMMELEQRRLEIEEAQNEVKKQGIANLLAAVGNLSSAIQSLVSDET